MSASCSERVDTSCLRHAVKGCSGSTRDSFAVNVKSVDAARAINVGHDQLVRFCVILGITKPVTHKTFTAIAKKVHAAAMKAAA